MFNDTPESRRAMIAGMLDAGEELRWFHYASDAGRDHKKRARSQTGFIVGGAMVVVALAVANRDSSHSTSSLVWPFAILVFIVSLLMALLANFFLKRHRYAYAVSDDHIFISHASGDFGARKLPFERVADVQVTGDSTLKLRLTEKIWEPFVSEVWYPLTWEDIPDAPTVKDLIEQLLSRSRKHTP